MTIFWPQRRSEWISAAILAVAIYHVFWFGWLCVVAITADGGGSFWVGLVRDFRLFSGWW